MTGIRDNSLDLIERSTQDELLCSGRLLGRRRWNLHLSLLFMPWFLLSLCLGHFSICLRGELLSIFQEPSLMSLLWSFLWYLSSDRKDHPSSESETTCCTLQGQPHHMALLLDTYLSPRPTASSLRTEIMFDSPWLAALSPQKVVRKCWLNRSIKMESECSKKMAIYSAL